MHLACCFAEFNSRKASMSITPVHDKVRAIAGAASDHSSSHRARPTPGTDNGVEGSVDTRHLVADAVGCPSPRPPSAAATGAPRSRRLPLRATAAAVAGGGGRTLRRHRAWDLLDANQLFGCPIRLQRVAERV